MTHRFLMTGWPFHGHVYPQIAVARALRQQGHEVVFFTDEQARGWIEGEGFQLVAATTIGRPWERIHVLERRLPSRRRAARSESAAFREWLLGSVPAQIADLEPVIARLAPDVIVSEPAFLAPPVVLGDKHGIPVALLATFLGTLIPGPDAPPAFGLGLAPARGLRGRALRTVADGITDVLAARMRRRVDALRAEHGLGPLGCSLNEHTGRLPLYLVPSVPELDYGRRDLPPTVHYVGRCTWQPPDDAATTAWLGRIPTGRPWVHASEGTSNQGEPFLLRMTAEALADLDAEVLLTTGQRDPADVALGTLPPNVHVTRFLQHDALLPRCAAMITNGGAGAVLSAMAAGVPLVVVPITSWDQPDNARRVVEAGAGLHVKPTTVTPHKLRAAVREVLEDPRYAANARRLRELLAAAGGPRLAADLLSALAADGRPVTATPAVAGATAGVKEPS